MMLSRPRFAHVLFAMVCRVILLGACFASGHAYAEPAQWKVEGWKTNFDRKTVEWHEIQSGGPPKDGIPSIDDPLFVPASADTTLARTEPVIALEIGGEARAYPLRVLIWHEIVNDIIGGVPVIVTYCPLCNSAIVFERRVADRLLEFGTTGKLRNSDLVMYDRQTESWWQQFTGTAIAGEFVGTELKLVPSRLISFDEFRTRHRDGRLLVPREPGARAYGRNPYGGYDSTATPFLYQGDLPKGIEPMARVIVVRADRTKPLVVTLEHVREAGAVVIGDIEVTWRAGQASAIDDAEIAKGRDIGTVDVVQVEPGGERKPVAYDVTFAFVAHAFHPESSIIRR